VGIIWFSSGSRSVSLLGRCLTPGPSSMYVYVCGTTTNQNKPKQNRDLKLGNLFLDKHMRIKVGS
jgi:hypothetical protein